MTRDLPGGWKQRLALACAVLHRPRVVFLDEPTSGVDPISRRRFWSLIDEMAAEGVTIFVTTHYLDEAEYCHRLAVIHAGKLAALGAIPELKRVFADRPVVELHTPNAVDTMRALESMPEVEKSSVFGTAVHAVLRPGQADATQLGSRLQHAGIAVERLHIVEPSLEDVFLDVVEKAGRS